LLADQTIIEFLNQTASAEPVPGGGSVSALCAALSAALSEMVANLTAGRKGYESVQAEMKAVAANASKLRQKFVRAIDQDSDAYRQVLAAFKLPKTTDAEKEIRSRSIQKAFKKAASIPFAVAYDALQLLDLAAEVVEKGNQNAVTDGLVGAMAARTAILGALYNVKTNLGSITDSEFVAKLTKEAQELESEVVDREKKILDRISF
jgi:formiminotetrahydrofolate cyclodeaminase